MKRLAWPISAGTIVIGLCGIAEAQVSTSAFTPQGGIIQPFGYGVVRQTLITASGKSGTAWCAALWGPKFQCTSVSGGNSCAATAPIGAVTSCNPAGTPTVDETAFQPINCQGQASGPLGPLGSKDWCLTANLEPARTNDTLYLYSDYVRLGLNKRFGGAVFELYGTDKENRLLQNGGGAMQLSLWGDDVGYAPLGSSIGYFAVPPSTTSCNATAFSSAQLCSSANGGSSCAPGLISSNVSDCKTQFACIDNGAAAGAPINPIQAISAGCGYGVSSGSNDEAAISSVVSPQPNVLVLQKTAPQQFTKSTNYQTLGLTWSETAHIHGPFALLSYKITYTGATPWNADFQEIPALYTHQGMAGGQIYYYSGSTPYQNSQSAVTQATAPASDTHVQIYQLPNRLGPFGTGVPSGYGANLTEDWVSLCDTTGTKCITIASWSGDAQDVVYFPGDSAYFGIHGFFAVAPGMNKTINVWVAPYRFDNVVNGMSVRQWVYTLRGQPPGGLLADQTP